MAVRALKAAIISGGARLQEPVFLCTVQTDEDLRGEVYKVLNKRRGKLVEDEVINNQCVIKYNLPVAESFGLVAALSEATGGRAIP